ncbi:MAG: ribosome biogenesis GTPase Der [bacterium]|nr:ribosome biogenesis GTPase Der [bacterium]
MPLRTVAIIGRPNVGKSTLFNRIIGEKRSVVHETAGVTRDRIAETTDWAGHPFLLLDTGGIIPFGESGSDFDALVTEIARAAIEEADLVLFLVDAKVGPMAWDESIARDLRKRGKPVVLACNKVEKDADRSTLAEFYSLGVGEPQPISALHGRGVGDLLDEVVTGFPTHEVEQPCDCRVAILGRPNVGKSSLLNVLVGKEEALVSTIPGTTRDSVHTDLKWHGHTIRLIDTAGLKRKSKVKEAIEVFSNMRTLRALELCDVAVLMVDADAGPVSQDAKIAGLIHDAGKGVAVCFNKWDLISKETNTHLGHWEKFCDSVPFLGYAPWFTASALTRQRTGRIMETVWQIHEGRQQRIATSVLNEFLEGVIRYQQPRAHGGGLGKIYYATQVESAPPVFVLSVNEPKFFARNYLRFLNNQLRKEYGFTGSRIFVKMKKH